MRIITFSIFLVLIGLFSCNQPKSPHEAIFEYNAPNDCRELTGCDQLTCAIRNCFCTNEDSEGGSVLFDSGIKIIDSETALKGLEKYFASNPDDRREIYETDSLGYNWYQIFCEEEMYTIGPEGKFYLIDCI